MHAGRVGRKYYTLCDAAKMGETEEMPMETIISEMDGRLKGIGEGCPSEYDSLTSIEEAEDLIASVTKAR